MHIELSFEDSEIEAVKVVVEGITAGCKMALVIGGV